MPHALSVAGVALGLGIAGAVAMMTSGLVPGREKRACVDPNQRVLDELVGGVAGGDGAAGHG